MMNESRARQLCLAGLVVVAASCVPQMPASAYTYGPTSEAEWAGWPEFCRVRYTVSDGGRLAQLGSKYPPEVISQWESKFGNCWGLLHHHCGALLQLQRAKSAIGREKSGGDTA